MSFPKYSIVIPCRNEAKFIGKCLDSLVDVDYPKDQLEVFVCDGESDDETPAIIEAYQKRYPFIQYLINKKRTTPFALNLGIRAASGEYLMILGAHAELHKHHIKNSIAAFAVDEKIGCTGGIIENVYLNNRAKVISAAMGSSFGVGNAHFRTGAKYGFVDTVAFGAYKKEVFENIGLFDEELVRNQDDEFNFRLLKNGYKIYLARNILSKYYVRASFKKLLKQYYQYGYWKVFVNKKYKTITTIRQLIPFLFVMYLFIGLILSAFVPYFWILFISILIIYFIAGFYFAGKKAANLKERFQIQWSFLLMHLGYGYGYLEGIVAFLIFNKKPKKASEALTR